MSNLLKKISDWLDLKERQRKCDHSYKWFGFWDYASDYRDTEVQHFVCTICGHELLIYNDDIAKKIYDINGEIRKLRILNKVKDDLTFSKQIALKDYANSIGVKKVDILSVNAVVEYYLKRGVDLLSISKIKAELAKTVR